MKRHLIVDLLQEISVSINKCLGRTIRRQWTVQGEEPLYGHRQYATTDASDAAIAVQCERAFVSFSEILSSLVECVRRRRFTCFIGFVLFYLYYMEE